MVIRFWAVSRHKTSLREALNRFIERRQSDDPDEFPIWLGREKKQGREPGWAKAYSRTRSYGVVNYQWNPRARTLICQAVSKGGGHPYLLLGEFISVLMRLPRKPVKSIHIESES